MKVLIQRVSFAHIEVDGKRIAAIDTGLLAFIGIEKQDNEESVDRLLHKILNYRVFSDGNDKMNLSLTDVNGGLLLVSQFTLAASTQKGLRPSFSSAADPDHAKHLYQYFVACATEKHSHTESGVFAADMKVLLNNDGPVTFLLEG